MKTKRYVFIIYWRLSGSTDKWDIWEEWNKYMYFICWEPEGHKLCVWKNTGQSLSGSHQMTCDDALKYWVPDHICIITI